MRTLVLAVVLAGCPSPPIDPGGPPPSGDDDDVPATPDATPEPDPVPVTDPTAVGPYAVGVKTIELTDPARGRSFEVDVWYPIASATDGRANTYELDSFIGSIASIDSPARRDAQPAAGTWPLVVFSHGFGGIRFQSYFLTERLASHGIVVAAPDHPGNTLVDFAQLGDEGAQAQSAIDRPLDVLYTLDQAIAGTLGVTVDPDRVAATGHSFGGWTCLEAARRDSRIRAVFPLAPGFRNGATDDFVASLARPVLFVGGSRDDTCEFPANQQAPYDKAQTPKYLLEVMEAGHLDFSNLCEVPIAKQFVDDGCDPAHIDPAVVHARTNVVATAFALRYLRDEPAYDAYLAPAAVTALGNVQYWSAP